MKQENENKIENLALKIVDLVESQEENYTIEELMSCHELCKLWLLGNVVSQETDEDDEEDYVIDLANHGKKLSITKELIDELWNKDDETL